MTFAGGCYCGEVRYEAGGEPLFKAQCHCRECQYITGGAPNLAMMMPAGGFRYTKGEPKSYKRPDAKAVASREFCATCGTHMTTRAPGLDAVIVKVGTMDEPAAYGGPDIAIFTSEQQAFHTIPAVAATFERLPG